MAVEPVFVVPDAISFEDAIALTQSLLDQMEAGEVPAAIVEQTVRDLVRSESGARGFFVIYLSDPRPMIDPSIPAVAEALKHSPAVVAPLLVKNLAMSTAMAITHRRNQNEIQAQGSDRVRSLSTLLIQSLSLPQLQEHAHSLATSIKTGSGDYQTFLERWGYDVEQKQAIYVSLEQAGLL